MERPDIAPLPESFWQHILRKRLRSPTPQRLDAASLASYQAWLAATAQAVAADLCRVRTDVWHTLTPLVGARLLTRPNLIALLNHHGPRPLSPATLSRWRVRGLLRSTDDQQIAADNAAALLMMRMLLPDAKYGWLPSEVAPDEPHWWCWRQDTPDAAPYPCPVPLPSDMPPTASLWTPWHGASWAADWHVEEDRAVWRSMKRCS